MDVSSVDFCIIIVISLPVVYREPVVYYVPVAEVGVSNAPVAAALQPAAACWRRCGPAAAAVAAAGSTSACGCLENQLIHC